MVRCKKLHGFTLIELLVVIAIIALLVSILLPSLTKARDLARSVVCATQVKGIAQALHYYTADNEEKIPSAHYVLDGKSRFWFILLRPYMGGTDTQGWNSSDTRMESNDMLICPCDPDKGGEVSLGLPSQSVHSYNPNALVSATDQHTWGKSKKMSDILVPSNTFYAVDAAWYEYGSNGTNWLFPDRDEDGGEFASSTTYLLPDTWHDGKVNLGMFDAHVETVQIESLLSEGENENFWYIDR